ncbi:glycosyltransferase family 4 protein [Candidatus Fermentibacteria bacterium]|nr:glycosyltransferase family 4 protein [Candidatus Fermentibacteria bacterium]
MRVLFMDDSLDVGGKERLLVTLLGQFKGSRVDACLCILGKPGRLADRAAALASDSILLGRKASFSMPAVKRLHRYIEDKKIEIVHCNGVVDAFHAYLASKATGVKLVATVHGHETGWHLAVHKWVLARFDRIVAVSESHRMDLERSGYPARRMVSVPNSYDASFERPEPYSMPGLGNTGRLALVCVGRLDMLKDQKTLVRAVGILVSEGLDVTLDLVGDGHPRFRDSLVKIINETRLEDRVRILGTIDDVPGLLKNYDAFALASLSETFGIAAAEAMAVGLPVVLSDIPALRELIGNGQYGLLFDPGSPESAAGCLRRLMDRGFRHEMSVKALSRAAEYSPEVMTAKLSDLYMGLLCNDCRDGKCQG